MSPDNRTLDKEQAVATKETDEAPALRVGGPVRGDEASGTLLPPVPPDGDPATGVAGPAAGLLEPVTATRRFTLGLDRFSGLYVWAGVLVLFGIWIPKTFLTVNNVHIVAGDQAITAMLALALVLPLAAGVFDLSIAATMGFAVAITGYLLGQSVNPVLAGLVAIAGATAVGLVNGVVVVRLHVNSFIATLGMSSIMAALTYLLLNGQQLVAGFSPRFLDLGSKPLLGFPLPFWIMLVLAVVLYLIVEFTTTGRSLYASGGNPQAARLAGVRVDRIVFGTLVASGFLAGVVGVILASRLGSASSTVGPPYLLPAFSAVFLGSTQIKAGRVNVLGTLIAIYLLATGVKGLQLATSAAWVNDLFNGLALITAVALAARTRKR